MGWHPLLIALAACAHAKWHVIHGSHTSHNERRGPGNNRYLTYNETEGLNNQRIALENARLMAILLNRTLVVPDTIPPHDAGDPFPTKTCRVFTCDSLRVPWVSRALRGPPKRWPTRIRDDAARCGDVATCEDFLLDPPKNVVVEVPRLITRAKMIVDKLGAAYDAAHLRTGDYFDALYTDEVARGAVAHAKYRINKLRNVTMRRSRPLFLMTVRVPDGWGIGYDSVRTATSDFAEAVRGISIAERGVVESVVCANAHHFVATGSSSMSEWILRLRATPPPWSVLLKHAARPDPGVDCHSAWCFEVPPSERKALPPPPEPKLAPSRRESLDGPLYADELAAYNAARRQEHGGGQGHGGGHGRRRGQKRGGGDGKPTMVRESYQIRANSLGAGQGERRASWSSPLNSGAYSCIEGPEPRRNGA
ncbi:hypothetical protein JL721_12079 [Aureococcus anophagefferens]|nr:hypothetical protein JL721_12079 [Aureococcus anophagefferens]